MAEFEIIDAGGNVFLLDINNGLTWVLRCESSGHPYWVAIPRFNVEPAS